MSPPPPSPPSPDAAPELPERLQNVTEALAAARSEAAVFRVVLEPAVEALGAVAASVLLSADGDRRLRLVAVSLSGAGAAGTGGQERAGEEAAADGQTVADGQTAMGGHTAVRHQTMWRDGALDGSTPGGDALLRREALYFEHLGALTARYPQVEGRHTGAVAAVATAVLPMLLDDQPLGVLMLDFREPHTFTAPERRFLQTLAGQCAVALGRVQALGDLDAQVRARTAELEAVLDCLSDAVFVGDMDGITRVNRAGLQMLGYSDPQQLKRRLETLSEQLYQRDPLTRARLPREQEPFARALRGESVTAEVLARRQDSGEDRLLRVAASPMLQGGRRVGAVAVGSDLTERRHELEVERGALSAFVAFTEDAGRFQDVDALASSAFLALGRLFPGSRAALYHWRDDCWQLHAGAEQDPEGHPLLGRCLMPETPLLAQMVWTRAAAFRDAGGDTDRADGSNADAGIEDAGNGNTGNEDGERWGRDAAEEPATGEPAAQTAFVPLPPDTRVCAYPIVREGLIVTALLVWGGPDPRWGARERATVTAIGRSFSLLYDRISVASALRARQQEAEARAREAEAEREALDAFVAFSEASGQITGQEELTRAAFEVLERLLPPHGSTLYAWTEREWRAQFSRPAQALEAGAADAAPGLGRPLVLPPTSPLMRELLQSRAPVFRDAGVIPGTALGRLPGSERGLALAIYPIEQGGAVVAALVTVLDSVGSLAGGPAGEQWTARDRAILSAVGRSFSLLYERVGTAAALMEQKREAETRTQALEAFAELTSRLDVQGDRAALVRRAQEVVLSVLPLGMAVYYEPQDPDPQHPDPQAPQGRWRARVQVGEALSAEMQRRLDAGLDRRQFPVLTQPWERGEPLYQDSHSPPVPPSPEPCRAGQTGLEGQGPHPQGLDHQGLGAVNLGAVNLGAVAALPLLQGGAAVGVFTVLLERAHRWSRADRALLEGVLRSLALALERVEGVAQLAVRSLELERSNAALSGANDELEAFAYSASHDLRTPVRHVLGFADLAEQELRKGNTDKVVRHLSVVRGAATRMNTLIDAMLLLSRAGRKAFRTETVPLPALVRQAQQDAAAEFPGWPVEWRVSPLPSVQGDRDTLQQVMTNLISNAVKYSRRLEKGASGAASPGSVSPGVVPSGSVRPSVVEVWAERGPQEVRVSVRDNGVGFDPRYQDKLFGVFQRLHSQEEFQGTGVGLATVKRIVSRYGGQVFAQGKPGEGATFGFTLPLQSRVRALGAPRQPANDAEVP